MSAKESEDTQESKDNACVPCEVFVGGPKPDACLRFKEYLTPEEEEVLSMLRQLKEQARALRGKIRGLDRVLDKALLSKPEESLSQGEKDHYRAQKDLYEKWKACSEQLEELRAIWKEWEARREEARHRKMVLLGHAPWGEGTKE